MVDVLLRSEQFVEAPALLQVQTTQTREKGRPEMMAERILPQQMPFETACQYVGILQTKRQRKKWEKRRGIAYRTASEHCDVPEDVIEPDERFALVKQQLATRGTYN